MSKHKAMSARETRVAKSHLIDYGKLESKPQRAAIRLGGGLNAAHWLDESSAAGYYVGRPDKDGAVALR